MANTQSSDASKWGQDCSVSIWNEWGEISQLKLDIRKWVCQGNRHPKSSMDLQVMVKQGLLSGQEQVRDNDLLPENSQLTVKSLFNV